MAQADMFLSGEHASFQVTVGAAVPAATVTLKYRLLVGAALLTAFVFFCVIRELGYIHEYYLILLFLGIHPFHIAFVDTQGVLSAAECYRLGIDVYNTNPCDILHRVHNYSPLWLHIVPVRFGAADTWWIGGTLAVLFLLSLAWLCPAVSRREFWLFLALCCSSAVVLGTERANMDIVMFMLLLLAGKLFPFQSWRLVSYGAVLGATALKFYPLVSFSVLILERPRRVVPVAVCTVGIVLTLALLWEGEIVTASKHFPVEYLGGMFSAYNLVGTPVAVIPRKFGFLEPYVGPITWLLVLIAILLALGLAVRLLRMGVQFPKNLEGVALFICGGASIVGCFVVGHNVYYRGVLLLLTAPFLFTCRRDVSPKVRLIGTRGIALVTFAVFSNSLRLKLHSVAVVVGGGVPFYTSFGFFGIEEAAWWLLVITILTVIFCVALESPIADAGHSFARKLIWSREITSDYRK